MNKKFQISILSFKVIALVAFTFGKGVSQDSLVTTVDTIVSDLTTENVEVIKAFEVKLADATMLKMKPKLPTLVPVDKKYQYDVTIIPYDISYPDPVIKPIAMRADEEDEYYNYIFKAGYGNLKNPNVDLKAHHNFSDIYDWNFNLNYNAADNSKEIPNQKYSSFYGSSSLSFSVLETSKLEVGINGGLDKRYFYYDQEDLIVKPTESEALRDISRFGGDIHFYNAFDNSTKVDYDLKFKGRYTSLSDIDENEFNGIASVRLTKRNSKNLSFTFAGGGDFNSSLDNNDIIGFFEPRLAISGSKSSIQIGLDYINANESSYVFPKSIIKYAIDDKVLQFFAGTEQSYLRNNISNLIQINPFLLGTDTLSTTITKDYFGGVTGDILGLVYSFKGGYKNLKNQAFYNTEFGDPLRRIRAGTTNLNTTYVSATLEVPVKDFLNVGGSFTQNFFSDIESDELWHIPSLEFNGFAKLNFLDNKLFINSNLYLRNSAKVVTISGTGNLENMIDLNIELEYFPVKTAGVYVKGKNLLDKSYRRWYSYPTLGIHVEGGITLKF